MERKETQITSSWLGMVGTGPCPACSNSIRLEFGGPLYILCINCGTYLESKNKKLREIDADFVARQPAFGVPTPWDDMHAPRSTTIALSTDDFLMDAMMTKKEGVRIFDAKWPSGCCVCSEAATREGTIATVVVFTPPGLIRIRDKQAKVIAKGIPYCAEHSEGVKLDGVPLNSQDTCLSLLFRSYAYRNKFWKMNPWKWS